MIMAKKEKKAEKIRIIKSGKHYKMYLVQINVNQLIIHI